MFAKRDAPPVEATNSTPERAGVGTLRLCQRVQAEPHKSASSKRIFASVFVHLKKVKACVNQTMVVKVLARHVSLILTMLNRLRDVCLEAQVKHTACARNMPHSFTRLRTAVQDITTRYDIYIEQAPPGTSFFAERDADESAPTLPAVHSGATTSSTLHCTTGTDTTCILFHTMSLCSK